MELQCEFFMKKDHHREFIQFSVIMELYAIEGQENFHLLEMYDERFWSTRVTYGTFP